MAAGDHNHSGVYATAGHGHAITVSTATLNYKDHSGVNQSMTVVTNVTLP